MNIDHFKSIVVIVAHPDDETLWAGGTILNYPHHNWFILCLCRASDPERSKRFNKALKKLKVRGVMGDVDDGPDQTPLDENELENEILRLLPSATFDLVITHNSTGEYTKHLRHEEVNKAVIKLLHDGKISAKELWTFAYEDGNKAYFPQVDSHADICRKLSDKIFDIKYKIITDIYGFREDSWEAQATPSSEAFWQFLYPKEVFHTVYGYNDEIQMAKMNILKLLSNPGFKKY